ARGPVVGQSVTPEAQQLQADYQKFTTDVSPALAALIQADTARVNASGAAALYTAYLPAVADLIDHAAGSPVEAALSKTLDSLVNKSPELAANVKAYRAVTDETLRWRARIASEQAQAKAAQLPTLASAAVAAFTTTKDAPGFWPAETARTDKARMQSPVGNVLTLLAPQAIGKPASVTAISSLGGTSSAGIARFHERIYARVPLPMEKFAPEVAALQAALFATETAPPLTLVATQALRGAQRGDVVQAGGTISGVYVEGHIARFAALKDAAALIVPLGSLPPTHPDYDQVDQVVLRFDLQPTWLQQRYFVVEP
ncbi:MAG TPA: hypothetical protein VL096_06030, partial [Pirellulaceae bacterium]|nr:hypothetical protein [Pirellulaceae bacterium]